jgi:two-component system, NarL family, nitrate/nitrite response regulator NarL
MKDNQSKIKIILADEHAIYREALRNLLEQETEFTVIGEASDGNNLLSQAALLEPDIILMDYAIPSVPALDVLCRLKGNSKTTVLMMADYIDGAHIVDSLRIGAGGVVLKDSTPTVLFESIRAVASGDCWIDPRNVRDLVYALRKGTAKSQEPKSGPISLTPREIEIIAEVVDGSTNKNIADKLSIAEQTVKHHLTSIFQKVGVSNRLELAVYAMHRGIDNKTDGNLRESVQNGNLSGQR